MLNNGSINWNGKKLCIGEYNKSNAGDPIVLWSKNIDTLWLLKFGNISICVNKLRTTTMRNNAKMMAEHPNNVWVDNSISYTDFASRMNLKIENIASSINKPYSTQTLLTHCYPEPV